MAKVWVGFCAVLVFCTPEVGSPKSHFHPLMLCVPLTVDWSEKDTGVPLQCPEFWKAAAGASRMFTWLLSDRVQPSLLVTVRVTLKMPVPE